MQSQGFASIISNRFKFRLFMLRQIPAAFFSGLRVCGFSPSQCVVSVPYKWATKNPFRSTYFACLAMAAELTTGALAMSYVYGRSPAVSMLVTGMDATFHKKATGLTIFTCSDGERFQQAVALAIATGEAVAVQAVSQGLNAQGALVAEFKIMWSFKVKM